MSTLEEIQVQTWSPGSFTDEDLVLVLDEVLADLLGKRVREAIYGYMERERNIAKEELPRHLDTFSRVLETTFGKGAGTIERMVVRRLAQKDLTR